MKNVVPEEQFRKELINGPQRLWLPNLLKNKTTYQYESSARLPSLQVQRIANKQVELSQKYWGPIADINL